MMLAAGLTSRQAQACCAGDPDPDDTDFAVLYESDTHSLHFSNSNVAGNIGIGNSGGFVGSGSGTITGTVAFATPNTGQFNLDSSDIVVIGAPPMGTQIFSLESALIEASGLSKGAAISR